MKKTFKLLSIVALTSFAAGLCISSAANAQSITDGNFYGGTGVEYDADSATAFVGYENMDGKLYYAVEAAYEFSNTDQTALTARAGVEMYDNFVLYGIAGHGWQVEGKSQLEGVRYGFGGKYTIDSNFAVSTEYVHQELGLGRSGDQTNIRGTFKF